MGLFGIPVTITNKLADGLAILADMSNVAIARDVAPSVTLLTERYAAKRSSADTSALRALTEFTISLLNSSLTSAVIATGRHLPVHSDSLRSTGQPPGSAPPA